MVLRLPPAKPVNSIRVAPTSVTQRPAAGAKRLTVSNVGTPAPYDRKLPDVTNKNDKAISIRLSGQHREYLTESMKVLDSDRSEAMRRAIRLLRLALSGHNAVLTVTDRNGKVNTYNVMKDGIPI
jgi:hypothetical protein